MSKALLVGLGIFLLVLLVGGYAYMTYHHVTPPPTPVEIVEEETSNSFPKMTVKSYLVATGDEGSKGKLIGCGDSLVSITREIEPTKDQIGGAMSELLSLEKEDYQSEGLYNALDLSELKLDRVVQKNRHADVYLTGVFSLGGVCDEPRFKEQLEATAMQFPIVDTVTIYINDHPLEEIISSK